MDNNELSTNLAEVGTDAISRQQAIDAARDWYEGLICGSFKGLEKRLRALPPALSEEDCETCKHGYFGDTYCNNCKVRFPSHYERRTDG